MESMLNMAEEENIIIDIEDDSDDEDNNNEQENNDNDESEEGNNNEQENYEGDDGEGSNDENEDDEGSNDEQENNENDNDEEGNDEENNDDNNEAENGCENDVCEDNNSEQSDASSNNGETESSDIEDSQRVNVETNNQQHIETRVDMEYVQQVKNGPNCVKRSSASNEILQSSSAHKKQNCKKWKGNGKSTNTNDGVKVQEPYHKQGHKACNKSGACRKDVANVKNPPSRKSHDADGGTSKNVSSSSVQKNDSNSKGKSINKGGNSQVWKNTSNSNSNKNNNSNSNKSSSGSDNKYGSSNDSNIKGKGHPNNNTFNNNNHKNNNNDNNNNNSNNKNQNNNNSNNKNNSNNNNNNKNQNNKNNNKQKGEQPPRNLIKEIKEVMDGILKKKFSIYPLDSSILKLHYRLTVLLFLVLHTVIQACWIWKESIFCVYGNNADATVSYYIKNFCLTYPFVYEDQLDDQSQRRYILFYRWTHLSFLFLSSLFYIPRVFVKFFNNPRVKQLLHDLARGEHQYDASKWEQDTNMMLQYMNSHASTHGYLYFWLIICHMVALVIDLAVVLYFDYVLQGHFRNLVYSAYPLYRDPQFFTDYLSRTFPPFVRCRLEKQVLINNKREEELGCHLLLMDIYDKMFVVIWLWLVFLIFCTTITILALLVLVIPPFNRLFLNIHTDSKHMKKIRNKILKKYCVTDLFVLYLMKCHRSESQFCMLISELLHSEETSDMSLALSKKKSKVSFKDEMASKTGHLQESPPSSQEEQWCTKNTLHYSPIFPRDEMLRSRRVNSSTPCPDYDTDISFPRNFMKNEYKV